jgi:4-methyl-5(b-hydroxyethyl)-thiazole monophosphate biosynthesis
MGSGKNRRVLAILGRGFEEIEAVVPVDILRRAGVAVTLAWTGEESAVVGAHGISVLADRPIAPCSMDDFDALLIPGGAAVGHLRKNEEVRRLVLEAVEGKKLIAAICAAPRILNDLGLLAGRHFTAYPSVLEELPDGDATRSVVEDGLLITADGPGSAAAFGLAVVRHLVDGATAGEVAAIARFPSL